MSTTARTSLPMFPKLPHMQCDKGCGKCCGPVTASADELSRIKSYIAEHGIEPIRQGIICPLYQDGLCSVHPVRPLICAMFGHTPKMVCAHGYNVNIPAKREEKIMARYIREGEPFDFLHALVYTQDEFMEILKADLKEKN